MASRTEAMRTYSPARARRLEAQMRAIELEMGDCRACSGTGVTYDDFEGALFTCPACHAGGLP